MIVSATAVSPCKECTERKLHCHSQCSKYKEYKAILERNREVIHAQTEEQEFVLSVKQRVIRNYIKHRGHKKGDKE